MTAAVVISLDPQEAVDLHTIIKRIREAEAKSAEPSPEFDARLRDTARALERGLRSCGWVPGDDGWKRVPPSRRR